MSINIENELTNFGGWEKNKIRNMLRQEFKYVVLLGVIGTLIIVWIFI